MILKSVQSRYKKTFCVSRNSLYVEHDFCEVEIGTYDQQRITSYRHNKQENNQSL